jgi:hypothetical protein
MRDKRGWQRKGWLIGAIFFAMMAGWYLDRHYGKGLGTELTVAVFLCFGIAVFVGFLSDIGLSEVQATDEAVARAYYGHGVGASFWRYQDILSFTLIPPERSGRSFGLMVLVMRTSTELVGVPASVSASELIEFFKRHGVREDDGGLLG